MEGKAFHDAPSGTARPEPIDGRSLGHRAPLLWLVLPFLSGLAAGQAMGADAVRAPLALALAAAVGAWAAARWRPKAWVPAIVTAMFLAGIASQALHRARLADWEELPPREARLGLRLERLFAVRDASRVSGLARVTSAESHLRDLVGQRVYFSITRGEDEGAPIRSTVVLAVGVLATLPRHPPGDTFDGYLANAGINFKFTRGRVSGVERAPHPYYRFCADAAAHFKRILDQGIAEKRPALAALLRGMMLGETGELSDEQRELFMQSGTMHLFAISGMNIGVIAAALHALLALLRVPRRAAVVLGVATLWLFVDITGASPSAVRAWAMAAFLQAAFVFRRPASVLAALVASALAVLLLAPLQAFSASFLLSYSIVLALLVLGLPLGEAWAQRWSPWRDLPKPAWRWWQHWVDLGWRAAAMAVAVGVATTLVSLLTSVQYFRLLTPGALVSNLVLIPAASVVTLGGLGALICGLVGFSPGAVLCNHAAALVLQVIERLVQFSVTVPGTFLPARFVAPWVGPAALALLLATLLVGYAGGWRRSLGGWWPPFIVVALALVLGVRVVG